MSMYDNLMNITGFFSSIPAGMIDRIYLEEPKGVVANTWAFLRIRALYLSFLVLSAIDIAVDGVLVLRYALGTLFTGEATQDNRLSWQKKYATSFGNRLYALLASPIGFIFPKLIIFYFTPDKKNVSGVTAGGDYHQATHAERRQPKDVVELQELVKQAIREGRQIIPMGAGRSQGKQFLPERNKQTPFVIDLQGMKNIEINSTAQTAKVGAGVLWSDLQLMANKSKMAVKVMQASNVFSVGGSIGANIHGWDFKSGAIANTIVSMEIINNQGELQTLTPKDTLFHYITGGFGLYGIVYNVTIQLAKNETLRREAESIAPKAYAHYFEKNVQNSDKTKLHLYRLSLDPANLLSEGFTETYVSTDDKAVETSNLTIELSRGTRFQHILINIARRFGWARKLWWDGERANFMDNHPTQTTNEIMQAPINAMFNPSVSETEWLQEYFLPGDKLASFLEDIAKILMANEVVLLNATVRFVKQHNASPLSYAAEGDRFAVVICFNQSLQPSEIIRAKKWLREAQHLAVETGGTYYLPYQHVSNPDDFKRSFPRATVAQTYKEQIDPKQLFTSGFHQKYMVPHPNTKNHVQFVLGNLKLKVLFEGFLKNIFQRVEAQKIYALLGDILTYNDTHAEIYQELCDRLPEIMPSTLGDLSNKLSSLAAIKKDLGAQARALLPKHLKKIDGIVEIGSPGRFAEGFKQHYTVTGNIVAVNETQSLGDYVDAGSLHPYDHYVKLDYSNLDLSTIADKSADVITCYVGLHHFPDDKLDVFLVDAKRILREDGHFLLVDHNVGDEHSDTLAMAHLAHFIFNAVNGVPLAEEMQEVRNFKPMAYWRAKLIQHGLSDSTLDTDMLAREGDPTMNCMISSVNRHPRKNAANNPSSAAKSPTQRFFSAEIEPTSAMDKTACKNPHAKR